MRGDVVGVVERGREFQQPHRRPAHVMQVGEGLTGRAAVRTVLLVPSPRQHTTTTMTTTTIITTVAQIINCERRE